MKDRAQLARNLNQENFHDIMDLCSHMNRDLVIFDTETSGLLNNPKSEILEIAWLYFTKNHMEWGWTLVKPKYDFPAKITEINGLDYRTCQTHGCSQEKLGEILLNHFHEDCVISGFNSRSFDMPMLRRFFPGMFRRELDVRDIHTQTARTMKGKLTDLCIKNGIAVIDAHEAMADTIMTAYLLCRYINTFGIKKVAGFVNNPWQEQEFQGAFKKQPEIFPARMMRITRQLRKAEEEDLDICEAEALFNRRLIYGTC